MKIEIKHRYSGQVIFTHEEDNNTPSITLQAAISANTSLDGAYLSNIRFGALDLTNANLSGIICSGVSFSGSNLKNVNFTDAVIEDSYFNYTDLTSANFTNAILKSSCARSAKFDYCNFKNSIVQYTDFTNASFRFALLDDADFTCTYLDGVDLSHVDLMKVSFIADKDDGSKLHATPEQSIRNLDKVRDIVIHNSHRLDMDRWHKNPMWTKCTPEHEIACGTTHCLAGWLQVCSTNSDVRTLGSASFAGLLCAPVAAKMFFKGRDEVLTWLQQRQYVFDQPRQFH